MCTVSSFFLSGCSEKCVPEQSKRCFPKGETVICSQHAEVGRFHVHIGGLRKGGVWLEPQCHPPQTGRKDWKCPELGETPGLQSGQCSIRIQDTFYLTGCCPESLKSTECITVKYLSIYAVANGDLSIWCINSGHFCSSAVTLVLDT